MPTTAEVAEFLAREFPQTRCTVREIGARSAIVSHRRHVLAPPEPSARRTVDSHGA
jgi:hypothetical protein